MAQPSLIRESVGKRIKCLFSTKSSKPSGLPRTERTPIVCQCVRDRVTVCGATAGLVGQGSMAPKGQQQHKQQQQHQPKRHQPKRHPHKWHPHKRHQWYNQRWWQPLHQQPAHKAPQWWQSLHPLALGPLWSCHCHVVRMCCTQCKAQCTQVRPHLGWCCCWVATELWGVVGIIACVQSGGYSLSTGDFIPTAAIAHNADAVLRAVQRARGISHFC